MLLRLSAAVTLAASAACGAAGDASKDPRSADAFVQGTDEDAGYQPQPGQQFAQAGPIQNTPMQNAAPNQAQGNRQMQAVDARGLPQGAFHMQRFDLVDQSGFEKPLTAYTILAPVGWRAEGGVVWANNMSGCGPSTPHVAWRAIAPDGASAVEIIPEESWSGFAIQSATPYQMPQQQGPCPNVLVQSGREFINSYIQRHRPGARVLDYKDITAEYANFQKMLDQMAMAPMAGIESRSWIEGGQALLALQANGREYREVMTVAAMISLSRMADGMGGYFDSGFVVALPGYAYRAPNGQLDFNLSEFVRKSGREDPEWGRRMAAYRAKISKINSDGARQRQKITADTNKEIFAMQQETWRNTQASQDRNNREFGEMIRGVETYDDPINGGTVQLDHTYDNAWQLNDGSYVLTNDTSFEPYKDLGVDGSRLNKTE
jgi:hypothetical protein